MNKDSEPIPLSFCLCSIVYDQLIRAQLVWVQLFEINCFPSGILVCKFVFQFEQTFFLQLIEGLIHSFCGKKACCKAAFFFGMMNGFKFGTLGIA